MAVFPRLRSAIDPWQNGIFANTVLAIRPPEFPKRDFAITKFGAKAGC